MVDFNNETTLTTPSYDLLKILILEKRENLILAVEFYYNDKARGGDTDNELGTWKARTWALFLELYSWINRVRPEDMAALKEGLDTGTEASLMDLFIYFNAFLDDFGLIKIDDKIVIDKFDLEGENAHHGL